MYYQSYCFIKSWLLTNSKNEDDFYPNVKYLRWELMWFSQRLKVGMLGRNFDWDLGQNSMTYLGKFKSFKGTFLCTFLLSMLFLLLLSFWETEKTGERWCGQDAWRIKRVPWKYYVNKLSFSCIFIIKTNKLERWNKNN